MSAPFTISCTLLSEVDGSYAEESVNLPAEWCICAACRGAGTSSAYLGAFSARDFAEDPDFAEAYMRGEYDRACESCSGLGRVLRVDRENTPSELLARYDATERDLAAMRAEERAERRWFEGGAL